MLRQSKTIMGLDIKPTKANAIKLAHDLAQLQADLFRQTSMEDFLDQSPGEGHLNYELNKFGVAVQQAIKADLRSNPEKTFFEFYVNVLQACHAANNYEIAARVCCGINDALLMDEINTDAFELPVEDVEVKQVRDTLRLSQKKVKGWGELRDVELPAPAKAKDIYSKLMESQTSFVPSIQAVMNYIAIRLDNAGSCYIDESISKKAKLSRLLEMKDEILRELFFISNLFEHLPKKTLLHFGSLSDLFDSSLKMILHPPQGSSSTMLDEMLKINQLKAGMPNAVSDNEKKKSVTIKKVFRKSPRGLDAGRISARGESSKSVRGLFTVEQDSNDDDSQNRKESANKKSEPPGRKG